MLHPALCFLKSEEQGQDEDTDDGSNTHNQSQQSLGLIALIGSHLTEVGNNPEVGVVRMGDGHCTSTDGHNGQSTQCGSIQTQGIFDLDAFKRFMEAVDKAGIKTHIMAGIIPLKAAGMAKFMNANVPGIDVPQSMIDRLAAAAAEGKEKGVKGLPAKVGMEMAAEMIAKIKDEKLCDGVHIMAIGAEKNVPKILDLAGLSI